MKVFNNYAVISWLAICAVGMLVFIDTASASSLLSDESSNISSTPSLTTDCCAGNAKKPKQAWFLFAGGGCAADNNSQSNSTCTGGVTGTGPYTYTAETNQGVVIGSGVISVGDVFTIYNGGANLPNNTFIYINGGQEEIRIHFSCSEPLIIGERFGSLELLSTVNLDDIQCGNICPDPTINYTVDCTGNVFTYETTDYGDGYTYTWDFGVGASPATATGIGPHVVTYSNQSSVSVEMILENICPPPDYSSTWTAGSHFDSGSLSELFDGNTTNAERLHQGEEIVGVFDNMVSSTDAIQVYWSNEQQSSDQSDEWLGLDVYVSGDGGATGTTFSTSFEAIPVTGNQEFEITPGFDFNYIRIKSRAGENVGPDPYVREITINDNPINANNGGGSSNDCCDPNNDKPIELSFTFLGGGCAADDNSQGDKSDCTGGATGSGPFSWTAENGNGNLISSGSVSLGGDLVITDGGSNLPNPTFIDINNGEEIIEIHTSCSAPIIVGERYGSLMLIGMVNTSNESCNYVPPSSPCYACTNSIIESIIVGYSCSVLGIDEICGSSNGSATVTVTGGSGNFSYAWSNSASTATINGLSAGNYSVTVTDNDSACTTSCNVTIQNAGAITCSIDGVNTSCGLLNGTASVNVFDGSGNYSYSWSNGSTASNVSGLSAGSYSVTVTDNDSGCQTSCSVSIGSSIALSCSIDGVDTSCGLSNGTASVNCL